MNMTGTRRVAIVGTGSRAQLYMFNGSAGRLELQVVESSPRRTARIGTRLRAGQNAPGLDMAVIRARRRWTFS